MYPLRPDLAVDLTMLGFHQSVVLQSGEAALLQLSLIVRRLVLADFEGLAKLLAHFKQVSLSLPFLKVHVLCLQGLSDQQLFQIL